MLHSDLTPSTMLDLSVVKSSQRQSNDCLQLPLFSAFEIIKIKIKNLKGQGGENCKESYFFLIFFFQKAHQGELQIVETKNTPNIQRNSHCIPENAAKASSSSTFTQGLLQHDGKQQQQQQKLCSSYLQLISSRGKGRGEERGEKKKENQSSQMQRTQGE